MPEADDNESAEMMEPDCVAESSPIQFYMPENDEKILAATLRAFESGSLTPLIKEELRCTIQSRRLAAGKGELMLEEFKKPHKKKPMTDEEKKRAQTRRLQNREAAQRFRQRQKDQASYLSDKIKKLERSSNSLQTEMRRLKDERDELRTMLQDHLSVCTKVPQLPEMMYPKIEYPSQGCTYSPTNLTPFSLATSHCTDTGTSTSSVFFPDELSSNEKNCLSYDHLLEELEANTFHIVEDNGSMMQDLLQSHEIGQEVVITGKELSDSESSDDHRLDSCSSPETVSNYSSVSAESCPTEDTSIELNSALSATFSLVQMDTFCYEPFMNPTLTNDIILLDDNTS